MENIELENEIELRMNPRDFSMTSSDLIDVTNMFNVDEQEVAVIYSQIVERKREEIKDSVENVIGYFREKGVHYPTFNEFKKEFNNYDNSFVDDNILRKMHDSEINDENQMSLFEIKKMIHEELGSMWSEFDPNEFKGQAHDAARRDIGDDFEELGDSKFEKGIDPEEWVDDVDRNRLELPSEEEEVTRIARMMQKKKSHEDRFGLGTLNEDGVGPEGLFRAKDAEGKDIKKGDLVRPADGSDKKGRVKGFGDDGAGRQIIIVDYQWPTDKKFMEPKEMGKLRIYPEDLIVQTMDENDGGYGGDKLRAVKVTYSNGDTISTSMAAHLTDEEIIDYFAIGKEFNIGSVGDNVQTVKNVDILKEDESGPEFHFDKKSLYHWFQDALNQLEFYDEAVGAEVMERAFERDYDYKLKMNEMNEELDKELNEEEIDECENTDELDEARGLGHSVKNTGDRNVKKSDDHSHAPVTTLPEGKTLDDKIKTLSEGKIKKKDLLNFINEEAKKLAKDIKEEEK